MNMWTASHRNISWNPVVMSANHFLESIRSCLNWLSICPMSRCGNCGVAHVYSGHLYTEYVRDVAERGARLPANLVRRTLRNPFGIILWPAKGIRKPARLLGEMIQISRFGPPLRPRLPRRTPPAGSG